MTPTDTQMNDFLYNEELEYQYLQQTFGHDYFTARETLGSFVEASSHEIPILEAALERNSLRAFSRISMRMVSNLKLVGLSKEIDHIKKLRSQIARNGVDHHAKQMANQLIQQLDERKNLCAIEVDRLDRYLESVARGY